MVHRSDGNDAGSDAKLLQLPARFRDEAAAHFIASRGEKWRQRKNVKRGLPCPSRGRGVDLGMRQVWAQRSVPFASGRFTASYHCYVLYQVSPRKTPRTQFPVQPAQRIPGQKQSISILKKPY